jgi:hypothetical protein
VKLSASRCNLLIKDQGSLFTMSHPDGFYVLHMNRPYERAICIKLLRLIATNQTYVFHRFALDPKSVPDSATASHDKRAGSKKSGASTEKSVLSQYSDKSDFHIPSTAREIHLEVQLSKEKVDHLDEEQRSILRKLHAVQAAANNIELSRQMFRKYDADGSGTLDRNELRRLLDEVGLHLEAESFEQSMDVCDVDGSGELDVSYLLLFF